MASASTILAEGLTSKSLRSMRSAAKAISATGNAASTGAGTADGSPPRFEEALKAARRPREQERGRTAAEAAAKKAPAEERQKPMVEKRGAEPREVRRLQENGDKALAHPLKTVSGRAGPDAGATNSTNLEAKSPAAGTSTAQGAPKTPANDGSADGANAQGPVESAPAVSPTDAAAAASQQVPVAQPAVAVVSQQVAVAAPAAANDTPAPVPLAADFTQAQGKPAAPAEKVAAHEQPAKMHAPPKQEGETAGAPQTNKPAAHKGNGEQPPEGDAGKDQAAEADAKVPHPPALAKPVAKIVPRNDAVEIQDGATKNSPVAPPPAGEVTLAQDLMVELASGSGRTAAAMEHEPPRPAPSSSSVTGTPATTAAPAIDESADAAAPAQQLPQTQADQTFEQVVMGLRGKLDAHNGKAEIHLDPPNLGSLHVSIRLQNGTLTAEFQSSSDVVRDLLKSNMEKLKTVLEGQGIAVDKLAVNAPAEKALTPAPRMPPQGGANNDGRSAGQYTRDPQSGQKRSPGGGTFARLWREAGAAAEDAPIDLLG